MITEAQAETRGGVELMEFDIAMEAAVEEKGTKTHRRLLRRKPHLRRMATVISVREWEAEVLSGRATISAEGDNPILDFLRWLIENPEKFAKFIEIIMGLFAGAALATEE